MGVSKQDLWIVRPRLLERLTTEELVNIVLKPAISLGYETDLWTIGRLHRVIQEKYQVEVSQDTIWRRLREAGLTYQKPERQYFQVDEDARKEWMRSEAPKIRGTVKKRSALLYFQDEANVALTAFLGKTWSPRGKTPRQKVTGTRGGVAAMSAINGSGRLIFKLHKKRICSEEVIEFFGQMLKHHKNRHLVVVMDQAPPHTFHKNMNYINTKPRLHVFHVENRAEFLPSGQHGLVSHWWRNPVPDAKGVTSIFRASQGALDHVLDEL